MNYVRTVCFTYLEALCKYMLYFFSFELYHFRRYKIFENLANLRGGFTYSTRSRSKTARPPAA
jgi:hypothetical protein